MKIRGLYAVLAILCIIFTLFLLKETEEECIILTAPKIYSIYHSDDLETIEIEILTNQTDHFYFDKDYINNLSIENEEYTFPVTLLDVISKNETIIFEDNPYQSVTLKLRTELFSTDLLVQIEQANLSITYLNGENISLFIGEFNYLFKGEVRTELALQELSATYEEVDGVQTVGGVNLSLRNRSEQLLEIVDIELVASGVVTNLGMMQKREACLYNMTVSDCLYIDAYSFHIEPVDTILHETVLSNHTWNGYIPLSYVDYPYIDEFAIIITYKMNGTLYQFVLDDFPFMRTANFQESHEDWYREYIPKSTDS